MGNLFLRKIIVRNCKPEDDGRLNYLKPIVKLLFIFRKYDTKSDNRPNFDLLQGYSLRHFPLDKDMTEGITGDK